MPAISKQTIEQSIQTRHNLFIRFWFDVPVHIVLVLERHYRPIYFSISEKQNYPKHDVKIRLFEINVLFVIQLKTPPMVQDIMHHTKELDLVGGGA